MRAVSVLLPTFALALIMGRESPARDIAGQVIDSQTGEPIARAHVTIHVSPTEGQQSDLVAMTDATGNFSASHLPEGGCWLSAERPGYLGGGTVACAMPSGDAKTNPAVIRLTQQGVVTGLVINDKGVGIPSAVVQLFRWVAVEGRRRMQPVNSVESDESGRFRIFGVAAGRYYVGAAKAPSEGRAKVTYAPTLYPSARDIQGALPIELRPGSEEEIRIRLPTVAAHRISGQVQAAGRFTGIQLSPQDPNEFPLSPNVFPSWEEKTNTFSISGVPPGRYVLEATNGLVIDGQRRAMKAITVGETDLDGIVLEPSSLGDLSGKATLDGLPPPHGVISNITLLSSKNTASAKVEEDGSFRLSGLVAGFYRVTLVPVGSYYMRSIRQGGFDVSDGGVEIGDVPLAPLEIDVGAKGATVQGLVTRDGAKSPAATAVALFQKAGGKPVLRKQGFFGGPDRGPIAFTIQGVAPGDYLVFAWPSEAQIAYAEPEFQGQYEAFGKAISVGEGAMVSVVVDALLPK